METRQYGGIDWFRMIAAILVISIHTMPFLSISADVDLVFTRIIGRIAVPFFFMTTGFFQFSKGADWDRVKQFIMKLGKLYALSIMIYLPLNIYAGHYTAPLNAKAFILDILVNGTVYHLWYLPAVMLGVVLVAFLLNHFSTKIGLLIASLLYVMGVMGDSYYGFSASIEGVQQVYKVFFNVFDYTRNGLFFAPIFILLGALIYQMKLKSNFELYVVGLVISLSGLITEGIMLHHHQIPRHDSMYVMLIPTLFFLFQILLRWQVKSRPILRPLSLWIYLIHPWVIVFVRGAASIIGMKSLLVDHALVNFVIVTVLSILGVWSWLYNVKQSKASRS